MVEVHKTPGPQRREDQDDLHPCTEPGRQECEKTCVQPVWEDACVVCGNRIRRKLYTFIPLSHWNNMCYRKDAAVCYLEVKLECGFILKPYKQ